MKKEDIFMQLFNFSRPTYYKWKRENTPALKLMEKYFTDKDLIEFIEEGTIKRLEENNISNTKLKITETFLEDNAIYTTKDKIKAYTKKITDGGGYKLKDILMKALDGMDNYSETPNINHGKQRLIDTINGIEMTVLGIPVPLKIKGVSTWVEYNLSKLEAYILIKHHKQIFDMIDKEEKLKKSINSIWNW